MLGAVVSRAGSHIYDINYFCYENVRATHMDALQN